MSAPAVLCCGLAGKAWENAYPWTVASDNGHCAIAWYVTVVLPVPLLLTFLLFQRCEHPRRWSSWHRVNHPVPRLPPISFALWKSQSILCALSSRFAQCVIHNMLSPNLALTLASQIPNHGFCALRHLGRFRFSPLGCWRRFNFDVDRMESSKYSHEHGVIAEWSNRYISCDSDMVDWVLIII